jgi:hypothetical protein
MKRKLLTAAIFIWIGVQVAQAGGLSPAAEKETARSGVVVADVLEVKATVESIDPKKRILTLRGTQGSTITLRADKAVTHFDHLKKGDVVLADFVESIAIFMRAVSAAPNAAEARLVSVAPKGAKIGVLLAETFQLTAVVESIDFKARQVTLKEPNGNRRLVPVDKGFKNLERFRKGEEVALRMTEAIAIKVEKRK